MSVDNAPPAWQPDADPGRRCPNCGGHVSRDWCRVVGDNDDEISDCPRCATRSLGGDHAAGGGR